MLYTHPCYSNPLILWLCVVIQHQLLCPVDEYFVSNNRSGSHGIPFGGGTAGGLKPGRGYGQHPLLKIL